MNSESVSIPIPGYGCYYVCLLDILGFKKLVSKNYDANQNPPTIKDPQGLISVYETLKFLWEEMPRYLEGEKIPEIMQYGRKNPYHSVLIDCLEKCILDSRYEFSDTTVFFIKTSESDNDGLIKLITMCNLMNRMLKLILLKKFDLKVPLALRGAIAHGYAVMNREKRIFFGQPIIDAYELLNSLDWMGIVLHDSVTIIDRLTNSEELLVRFDKPLYAYKIPFNEKNREKYKDRPKIKYAINWVQGHPADENIYPGVTQGKPLLQDILYHLNNYDWGDEQEKKENTIRFATEICDKYAQSPEYHDIWSDKQKR